MLILASAIIIPVASGFAPGASFGERVLFGVIEGFVLAVITGQSLRAMQRRGIRRDNEFAARSRDAEAAARQDVAIYLHSAVQPKLLAISREIASLKTSETTAIAERLDAVSEEFIREVSHSLYPPELLVSLEFGLETLLAGRAELILDKRLSTSSPVGLLSSNFGQKYLKTELRLEVGTNLNWAIYSVVRELVANAEKKDDVKEIIVSVLVEEKSVIVKVSDDGHSLPKKLTKGLGHLNVEKITADFGGTFKIKNLPLGVEARCIFPYEPITSLTATKNRRVEIESKGNTPDV